MMTADKSMFASRSMLSIFPGDSVSPKEKGRHCEYGWPVRPLMFDYTKDPWKKTLRYKIIDKVQGVQLSLPNYDAAGEVAGSESVSIVGLMNWLQYAILV